MDTYSRRRFIKYLSTGMSALAIQQLLSACKQGNLTTNPEPTKQAAQDGSSTSEVGITDQIDISPTPTSYSDLAVVRNGNPEEMVRKAIAALGGMERFVPRGSTVVVKPNACVAYHTYEYAATTNPWVAGALVKMAFEAGASTVKVFDFPFGGSFQDAFAISGIGDQVVAAGAQLEPMQTLKFIDTDIPDGVNLTKARIYEDVLNADVLINVPIAKNHSLARLTLGMKNLMGIVLDRERLHRNIGQCLTDLNFQVKSTLTVIDAVRILTANGPTGGNLDDVRQTNTIIASPDVVAADSYAAQTLFDTNPDQLTYLIEATARGLGRSDLSNLKIEEIQVGS